MTLLNSRKTALYPGCASRVCRRRFVLLAASLLAGLVPIQARPGGVAHPQAGPALFRGRSQQINGVTVRLKDVRWVRLEEAVPGRNVSDPHIKGLGVWYDITASPQKVHLPQGKSLVDYLTFEPRSPWGEEVVGITYRYPGIWWTDTMDPRWSEARAEFEFRDPATPAGASGNFEDTVEFKNLPLPDGSHNYRTLHRVLTTAQGLRVFVDRISIRPGAAGSEVLFDVRWLPPLLVPDMAALLAVDQVTDNRGKDLSADAGFESGYDMVKMKEIERLVARVSPSPGAATVDLKVRALEKAPSLKQVKYFRRFRFDVQRDEIAFRSATDRPHLPVAMGAAGVVTVTLENWSIGPRANYSARLWLMGRKEKSAAPRSWMVTASRAFDDAGNQYQPDIEADNLNWKMDGSPALRGERGELISFRNPAPKGKPTRMTMEVALQAVRRTRHLFRFREAPIPPAGRAVQVNWAAADSEGTRLTFRKIIHFTDERPLPGWDDAQRRQFNHPSGLALIFEDRSSGRNNTVFDLDCVQCHDDQGRLLVPRFGPDEQDVAGGRQWTLYLLPPAQDTHHFNVDILLDETRGEERQQAVIQGLPVGGR